MPPASQPARNDVPDLIKSCMDCASRFVRIRPCALLIDLGFAKTRSLGRLIVSHIGEFDLDAAIAEPKKFYTGPMTVGADL